MTELVTIRTVAEAANCAVSTVSRALRDDPAISEKSKQRIREAAKSLNYRRLRRPRGETADSATAISPNRRLVVVTLGMDRSLTSLPVVNATLSGLEDSLSGIGQSLQITHVPDLENAPPHLLDDQPDGVFLIGALQGTMLTDRSNPFIDRLRELPTVWLLGRPEDCWGDSVGANDISVGTMSADHLADHGHQHVAFLSPKPDHLLMINRETGFLAQAMRRGLSVQRFVGSPAGGWPMPVKPPLTIDSVQHLVDGILNAKERPTAVFTSTDSVAAVAYGALAVRGVRVGEDISVISGNNDQPLIAGLHPALTTFDIQAHDIGRLAVQQMESRLRMKHQLPNTNLTIESHLVAGNSVRTLG